MSKKSIQELKEVIEGFANLSDNGKKELLNYLNYLLSKEGGADGN